jgi:hypothetical protein
MSASRETGSVLKGALKVQSRGRPKLAGAGRLACALRGGSEPSGREPGRAGGASRARMAQRNALDRDRADRRVIVLPMEDTMAKDDPKPYETCEALFLLGRLTRKSPDPDRAEEAARTLLGELADLVAFTPGAKVDKISKNEIIITARQTAVRVQHTGRGLFSVLEAGKVDVNSLWFNPATKRIEGRPESSTPGTVPRCRSALAVIVEEVGRFVEKANPDPPEEIDEAGPGGTAGV